VSEAKTESARVNTASIARDMIANAESASGMQSAVRDVENSRIDRIDDPGETPARSFTRSVAKDAVIKAGLAEVEADINAGKHPLRLNEWGMLVRRHDTRDMTLSRAAALDEFEAMDAFLDAGFYDGFYHDAQQIIRSSHDDWDFADGVNASAGETIFPPGATLDQITDVIAKRVEDRRKNG
jgi:hypothetical protein